MTGIRKMVGHVKTIFRYPVKSMRGEMLTEAPITWNGIEGDRRWAFIREGVLGGFPWLIARENAELVRYAPRYIEPDMVHESRVAVVTPDGRELALDGNDLKEDLIKLNGPVRLVSISRGYFDSAVVSLIGSASVRVLGEEASVEGAHAVSDPVSRWSQWPLLKRIGSGRRWLLVTGKTVRVSGLTVKISGVR